MAFTSLICPDWELINKQGQKEKKEVIEASINKDGKLVQKIFDEETGKYVSKEIIQTYDPVTKQYVTKLYNPVSGEYEKKDIIANIYDSKKINQKWKY